MPWSGTTRQAITSLDAGQKKKCRKKGFSGLLASLTLEEPGRVPPPPEGLVPWSAFPGMHSLGWGQPCGKTKFAIACGPNLPPEDFTRVQAGMGSPTSGGFLMPPATKCLTCQQNRGVWQTGRQGSSSGGWGLGVGVQDARTLRRGREFGPPDIGPCTLPFGTNPGTLMVEKLISIRGRLSNKLADIFAQILETRLE